MKKSIETFPRIHCKNFIYCFTSVYMFIEGLEITDDAHKHDNGHPCHGCGQCGHPRAKYIQLFETLCGRSATRCKYDGEPSEMQKMIGCYKIGNYFGQHIYTDYTAETIDFLFGLTGFEYHTYADKNEQGDNGGENRGDNGEREKDDKNSHSVYSLTQFRQDDQQDGHGVAYDDQDSRP